MQIICFLMMCPLLNIFPDLKDDIIRLGDLPIPVRGFSEEFTRPSLGKGTLPEQLQAMEKELILNALAESSGNQTLAGKLLGISERNLRYKLKKYNIKNQD